MPFRVRGRGARAKAEAVRSLSRPAARSSGRRRRRPPAGDRRRRPAAHAARLPVPGVVGGRGAAARAGRARRAL